MVATYLSCFIRIYSQENLQCSHYEYFLSRAIDCIMDVKGILPNTYLPEK